MSLSDEYLDGINEEVALQDAVEQSRVVIGEGELTPQQIDKMVAPVVDAAAPDKTKSVLTSIASALSQIVPALINKGKPAAPPPPPPPHEQSVDYKKVALIGAASVAGVGVLWMVGSALRGRGRK